VRDAGNHARFLNANFWQRTKSLIPRLLWMDRETAIGVERHRGQSSSEDRALVIGATGLIGSAIIARLKADGYSVIAVVRTEGPDSCRLPADRLLLLDLKDAVRPEDWEPHLFGVTVVINCAGVLQDGGRDSTRAVHHDGPAALFEACARVGLRRIIHFSAMGVDKSAPTDFSKTKASAEQMLQQSPLDWVILRPSVVIGRAAYGGSALFRGLATTPWLPRIADAGSISVVHLDDVVETVTRLIRDDAPSRIAIDLAGPERLTFEAVVARYRRWLGWRPARLVSFPLPLMSFCYAMGDVAGGLGWRPPVRTTARREMRRGAAGDPARWTQATGIVPRSMDQALLAEPASVQERWFARLFILKPIVIGVFAAFWLLTGFVSVGPGYNIGKALMIEGGAGALSGPIVIAGGLADFAIGVGILWRRSTKYALWGAIALTVFYVIAGTWILPRLWLDPLGPMMKVWPILVLNFVALAILDER
jgi:uncharacterized protein YbjT (DUF2867 family)